MYPELHIFQKVSINLCIIKTHFFFLPFVEETGTKNGLEKMARFPREVTQVSEFPSVWDDDDL